MGSFTIASLVNMGWLVFLAIQSSQLHDNDKGASSTHSRTGTELSLKTVAESLSSFVGFALGLGLRIIELPIGL